LRQGDGSGSGDSSGENWQEVRGVPLLLGQVDKVKAVICPDIVVRAGVAEEDDVRRGEHLLLALVLGADENAVLELLRKGVKVLGVLSLGARDVDADNGLLLIRVSHIDNAALQENRAVLKDEAAW